MTDGAASVRTHVDRALSAGERLRGSRIERRATWLSEGVALLGPHSELGREARDVLPESTGLSREMVDWGLRTTLDTIATEALLQLAVAARDVAGAEAGPISSLSLVLAGNVFTAPVRAVVVPLLVGVPVVAKASSKENEFASFLHRALREADEELGDALQVVEFGRGERDAERALLERAEAIGVYGGDDAVHAIAAHAPRNVKVVGHGHGVSVSFLGPDAPISETAQQLALDVAAYDQRGCLSPSVVYVEGLPNAAEELARALSAELDAIERRLPRGPLPDLVAVAQVQWRGLAMLDGTLLRGATHSVAVRPRGLPRWSPGYRNVVVVPVGGLDEAMQEMEAFSRNLKCIGTDDRTLPQLEAALGARGTWQAYATRAGTMQTPALDAPQDGLPIWHALLEPVRRR